MPKDNGFKKRGLNYGALHDAIDAFEWPTLVGTCKGVFGPKRAAAHWEDDDDDDDENDDDDDDDEGHGL